MLHRWEGRNQTTTLGSRTIHLPRLRPVLALGTQIGTAPVLGNDLTGACAAGAGTEAKLWSAGGRGRRHAPKRFRGVSATCGAGQGGNTASGKPPG
jgi:hypothetical protein